MLSFLREFWSFLRSRKKYWLLPIFVMMAALGGLLARLSHPMCLSDVVG